MNGKVLAFGDSLTYGTGAKPEQSYPAQLAKMIHRTVINAGVPGELSSHGLKRLPRVLDQYHPDLMILIHGGNDMLTNKSPARIAANLRAMIKEAQQRHIRVVMMAVPGPTMPLRPADFYMAVAREMNVPIEKDAITDVLRFPIDRSDIAHPNAKGYRLMAVRLEALLKRIHAL